MDILVVIILILKYENVRRLYLKDCLILLLIMVHVYFQLDVMIVRFYFFRMCFLDLRLREFVFIVE